MTWTAPKTFVANDVLTAAELNEQLRDNLNETLNGIATEEGQFFVVASENRMTTRTPQIARTSARESTTSTTYVDLSTIGPVVTIETGPNAFVFIGGSMENNTANSVAGMSFEISGATIALASDERSVSTDGLSAGYAWRTGTARYVDLNEGENTFTAKYKCGSNTATFQDRYIIVMPL